MKKLIIFGLIFLLVAGIPVTSAISAEKTTFIKNHMDEQPVQTLNDIPEWAIGNFTGVWGLNLDGEPQEPIGFVLGYYGNHRFAGVITNTTAPNGWIWGFRFNIFMIGIVTNINAEQKVPIVGIGVWNNEQFYYRLMSIVGPTIYIAGVYTLFE
jgi:hypothetical protein